MAATIDELTINWTDERDGKQKIKELKKEVLTRGGWTTIMYLMQELNSKTDQFGEPKIRIQRYQKRGDSYMPKSKFTITNVKQAYQIMDVIKAWYPEKPQQEEK
jgi:hypothetical protein